MYPFVNNTDPSLNSEDDDYLIKLKHVIMPATRYSSCVESLSPSIDNSIDSTSGKYWCNSDGTSLGYKEYVASDCSTSGGYVTGNVSVPYTTSDGYTFGCTCSSSSKYVKLEKFYNTSDETCSLDGQSRSDVIMQGTCMGLYEDDTPISFEVSCAGSEVSVVRYDGSLNCVDFAGSIVLNHTGASGACFNATGGASIRATCHTVGGDDSSEVAEEDELSLSDDDIIFLGIAIGYFFFVLILLSVCACKQQQTCCFSVKADKNEAVVDASQFAKAESFQEAAPSTYSGAENAEGYTEGQQQEAGAVPEGEEDAAPEEEAAAESPSQAGYNEEGAQHTEEGGGEQGEGEAATTPAMETAAAEEEFESHTQDETAAAAPEGTWESMNQAPAGDAGGEPGVTDPAAEYGSNSAGEEGGLPEYAVDPDEDAEEM